MADAPSLDAPLKRELGNFSPTAKKLLRRIAGCLSDGATQRKMPFSLTNDNAARNMAGDKKPKDSKSEKESAWCIYSSVESALARADKTIGDYLTLFKCDFSFRT